MFYIFILSRTSTHELALYISTVKEKEKIKSCFKISLKLYCVSILILFNKRGDEIVPCTRISIVRLKLQVIIKIVN